MMTTMTSTMTMRTTMTRSTTTSTTMTTMERAPDSITTTTTRVSPTQCVLSPSLAMKSIRMPTTTIWTLGATSTLMTTQACTAAARMMTLRATTMMTITMTGSTTAGGRVSRSQDGVMVASRNQDAVVTHPATRTSSQLNRQQTLWTTLTTGSRARHLHTLSHS